MTTTTTAKRTAKAMVLAALSFMLVSSFSPSQAVAWSWFDNNSRTVFGSHNIRYCFEPGFYTSSTVRNTTHSAADQWEIGLTLTETTYTAAPPYACDIHLSVVDFSSLGWLAAPMRTTRTPNYLGFTARADIFVNSDRTGSFWFYGADQDCNVGSCAKSIDYWTAIQHEVGHALGLGHSTTSQSALCSSGFATWDATGACWNDFYSLDVMYPFAADGYRRATQIDSTTA